jgi:5'-nucleotidase
MQRLLVDMDGVLADIYQQFLEFESALTGQRANLEDLYGKSEREAFPLHEQYVHSAGFFGNAPLIKGAVEAMEQLNQHYEVFIVSSATEFPQSLGEKHAWLQKHFPFISWRQMVFCGSKTAVSGDIMIDDHFKNLDHFKGRTLLFKQPHNVGLPAKNHERVHDWSQILQLLLP